MTAILEFFKRVWRPLSMLSDFAPPRRFMVSPIVILLVLLEIVLQLAHLMLVALVSTIFHVGFIAGVLMAIGYKLTHPAIADTWADMTNDALEAYFEFSSLHYVGCRIRV